MGEGFWDTMKILVGKEFTRNVHDDVHDWVEKVIPKRVDEVRVEDDKKKSAWTRRMSDVDEEINITISDEEIIKFKESLNLPKIECKFYHPVIRLRLERLMGTQITNLTDRQFMLNFQERLLEDYAHKMDKRCQDREFGELERLKDLVLKEIIPISAAPKQMANHPVMLIDKLCAKLIAARRAQIKIPKVTIPTFLYYDDTPDIDTGLKIGDGHVFRGPGEKLCLGVEKFQTYTEDDELKYSMTHDEYDKLVYVDAAVKEFLQCESVERMYFLANKIIGTLKLVDENTQKFYEDAGSDKFLTAEPAP
ncbi:unnamed protein product [Phyllotreta striolata]|uniref:Uncharacterized protein n=1 Tax=Phyllotreta striolata TaxID=444603 RepID=A0A9N9XPZ6_PHYSR|nr:unnamed protein product [Phyllotreta striolata]